MKTEPCKACGGTGENSRGGLCICKTTIEDVWYCPTCNSKHRGFRVNRCRNKDCDDYDVVVGDSGG
jgi:hypothetical protein